MLCNVNIDNGTTTCYSIDTGLPVILATASVCIGGSFVTSFAWRLFCCCCIAGEVSTKEVITTAAPKTKSNSKGECSIVCFCHAVEGDILLLRLSQFANHGALVTRKHGEQNASGWRHVAAAPNVLVGG